jgi:hypothetical protein
MPMNYSIICSGCGIIRNFNNIAELKRKCNSGFCRQCFLKHIPYGNKSPNWKNGITYRSGYRFISQQNHPFANNIGYVREHRLIVEKHLGRFLEPGEIIHHINRNRLDNRLENLKLTNQKSHASFHKPKQNRTCTLCKNRHLARGFCKYHYWTEYLKGHRFIIHSN